VVNIGRTGTTYWITGFAGAGKSTIGRLLYDHIKGEKENVVILDGDEIRAVFPNSDYTLEGRKHVTRQIGSFAKMLNGQNIDCICCVIGMINECRRWNRENIENYTEVYIRVPMDVLIKRDQKSLYSKALRREITNVWGVDLKAEEPQDPDIVIDNDRCKGADEVFAKLLSELKNISN